LGGTLNASLIDGFSPLPGQSFEILTAAGGVDGTFDHVNLPALPGGLYFDLAYAANAVTLSVAGQLGDYTHNNVVDAADFVLWRRTSEGQTGYNTWRSHFGQQSGGGGDALLATVPEPTPFIMVMLALMGLLMASRCHRPRPTAHVSP
jgi:hypothetical protein